MVYTPTGLILCSEKNDAVVKYSVLADAKQIFASKYERALPKPEELAYQIKMDRVLIEERMKSSEEELQAHLDLLLAEEK